MDKIPDSRNSLAQLLLQHPRKFNGSDDPDSVDVIDVTLCLQRLLAAKIAGVNLGAFSAPGRLKFLCACSPFGQSDLSKPRRRFFTLLDMAIIHGDVAFAEHCGSLGIGLESLELVVGLQAREVCPSCGASQLQALRFGVCTPLLLSIKGKTARWAAAGAALQAAVWALRQKAAKQMAIGLYQVMRSWACGKRISPRLVDLVLDLAANRPGLADAFEGREEDLLEALQLWRLEAG